MIGPEVVEIAARAMFAEEQCDRLQKLDLEANWLGRLDDHDRDEYRRLSGAVLKAVAAHEAEQELDQLRGIHSYPACATCDGGGCGDCV